MGGSSLGGLISYYGAMNYSMVFGKCLAMSPSFWIDSSYIDWKFEEIGPKCYVTAGKYEDEGDVKAKIDSLSNVWFLYQYTDYMICYPEDGVHNEWFWSREFGQGYQYLFSDLKYE